MPPKPSSVLTLAAGTELQRRNYYVEPVAIKYALDGTWGKNSSTPQLLLAFNWPPE